jgi:hypothetical protein
MLFTSSGKLMLSAARFVAAHDVLPGMLYVTSEVEPGQKPVARRTRSTQLCGALGTNRIA